MIFTTHAITGAAVASSMPDHPVLGFTAGFASHFLLDAIPHWDYKLLSKKENPENPLAEEITLNKDFVYDFLKMGGDAIFGFLVALFLFGISNSNLVWTPILGAVGALMPDALQFVYLKWKHEPMVSMQKFHTIWIHSKIGLNDRPVLGITLQIILILLVVAIFKFLI